MSAALKRPLFLFHALFPALLLLFLISPAKALEKPKTNSLGMAFVLLPSGSFTMGTPPEEPDRDKDEVSHRVTLEKPYYLQTTEVTVEQWMAVMGRGFLSRKPGPGNFPVTNVSWYDCAQFLERLNKKKEGRYRLPTEAEWEYACRAGTTTAYTWGEGLSCSQAMFCNNSLKCAACEDAIRDKGLAPNTPAPVGTYGPNAWGLYDMHGNVWEWCLDWYGDYPEGEATSPGGPASGSTKVRRGGSWFKYSHFCRSGNRNYGHPAARYQTTGFRLVWEPEAR